MYCEYHAYNTLVPVLQTNNNCTSKDINREKGTYFKGHPRKQPSTAIEFLELISVRYFSIQICCYIVKMKDILDTL